MNRPAFCALASPSSAASPGSPSMRSSTAAAPSAARPHLHASDRHLFGPWLGTLAALIGVLPLRATSAALFADRSRRSAGGRVVRAARQVAASRPARWSGWRRRARSGRCTVAVRRRLPARDHLADRAADRVSGLVAVVVADLLAAAPSAQRLVERSRPAERASCAATRFTRSCSSPRCRCCCWRRSTAS